MCFLGSFFQESCVIYFWWSVRLYFFIAYQNACCPASGVQMGQATWAIWPAIKKYSQLQDSIYCLVLLNNYGLCFLYFSPVTEIQSIHFYISENPKVSLQIWCNFFEQRWIAATLFGVGRQLFIVSPLRTYNSMLRIC